MCFEEVCSDLAAAAKPGTLHRPLLGPVLDCMLHGPAVWSLWRYECVGFPESGLMQCTDDKTQVGEQSHLQEGT